MKNSHYETLLGNFKNKVKSEEIKPYHNKVKKNTSNRVESWYLEKSKEGNFGMEYFSSVEERLHFFKKFKGFKIGSKSIDKIVNNLSIK